MTTRTIQILHVEDDKIQQRVVAHHLQSVEEFSFQIQCVPSEDEALRMIHQAPFDLVLLDYHLTQGDGLSCLKRIREHDSLVPILAISGTASHEIAALLVQVGADDYLDKSTLTREHLVRSVKLAIERSDAVKRFRTPPQMRFNHTLYQQLLEIIENSLPACQELQHHLAALSEKLHRETPDLQELRELFEAACQEQESRTGQRGIHDLCQPILLQLLFCAAEPAGEGQEEMSLCN